jgi:hypothetical protein
MKWFFTWLVTMCVLWGVPCSISAGLHYTPDALTASAEAGTFISSTGYGSTTTVQTTIGSVIVMGAFSSPKGQALFLERRLKSGLLLCIYGDSVCSPLAGPWPGRLRAVPYQRPALAFLVPWQDGLPSLYFDVLLLSFAVSFVFLAILVTVGKADKHSGEQAQHGEKTAL